MTYQVRHADLDDGEDLLGLWHGYSDHLSDYDPRYEHRGEDANERWLTYFENQLVDAKYGTVVVGEHEPTGDLVGVLEARIVGNHPIFRLENHGYINGHYVHPDHRGEGLGRALVEEAHDWFVSPPNAVDFYRVDVVEGDDEVAAIYESLGFEPVEHVYERTNEDR